jgi:hypothetical protein
MHIMCGIYYIEPLGRIYRVHDLEGKKPILEIRKVIPDIRKVISGLQSILNQPYHELPNIL